MKADATKNNLHLSDVIIHPDLEYDQGDKVTIYYDDLYDLYQQYELLYHAMNASHTQELKDILKYVERNNNRTHEEILGINND